MRHSTKRKNRRKKTKKLPAPFSHPFFFFALCLFFLGVVLLGLRKQIFSTAPISSANSLICPTPSGANSLQLVPCTLAPSPSEIISLPPLPFPSPVQTIALTPAPSNPTSCGIATGPAGAALLKGTDNTGKCCVEDGPAHSASECCPGIEDEPMTGSALGYPDWCDAKPVIYLYPKQQTTVSVKLTVPGSIVASDPHYPEIGWQHIEAYPSGLFEYQGKHYHELFYEASVTPIDPPTNGIIVPTANLEIELANLTRQLGLLPSEQQEFLHYWLPRLTQLHAPYILVSLFSPEQKDRIDHVDIVPKPDTFLQFILYYKPLSKPLTVHPLLLPTRLPQRQGFTAVEWGGIIDQK
jgi:hypothetical protein